MYKKINCKILLFLVISLSICILSVSCVNTATNTNYKDNDKELTVWLWDEHFNYVAIKEAEKKYQDEYPDFSVNIEVMLLSDIIDNIKTALSVYSPEDLPEIILVEDYSIQYLLSSFPQGIADLSNIINEDDFVPSKISACEFNEKVYGVPFDSGVAGLYYRIDILEESGYSSDNLNNITWQEFIEIGKDVKSKTGKHLLSFDPTNLELVRMMMQSSGEWYVEDDGITLNISENPSLKESLNIILEMIDAEIINIISDTSGFEEAFYNEEVLSVINSSWIINTLEENINQSGKWGLAPVPRLDDNEQSINSTSLGGSSWYVTNNSDNKDLAIDFLQSTLVEDTDLLDDLVTDINLTSSNIKLENSDSSKVQSTFINNQYVFKDLMNLSKKIPEVDYGKYTYEIEEIVGLAFEEILSGRDIDTALREAEERASTLGML